jgi:uncharacterized protein YcaQ
MEVARAFRTERKAEADAALARIVAEGPLAASDFEAKGAGGWWGWSSAKAALEWLFLTGRITTAMRRNSFERVYDLTERVIPARILDLPTPSEPDAHRALLELAARAHGLGTARDLRDYFRLSPADAAPRIAELVEEGLLLPVQVEDWRETAYLHRDAKRPRGRRGGRCWCRSIRSSGSEPAPSACSACATGSKSTRPRSAGCTVIMYCPSCCATASWRAWT